MTSFIGHLFCMVLSGFKKLRRILPSSLFLSTCHSYLSIIQSCVFIYFSDLISIDVIIKNLDIYQSVELWFLFITVRVPFFLNSPSIIVDINSDDNVDISGARNKIEEIALEASWQMIYSKILREFCLIVINDPSVAPPSIRQTTTNPNTYSIVSLITKAYYNIIKQYTDFLSKDGTWLLDVVQHFITHLDFDIFIEKKWLWLQFYHSQKRCIQPIWKPSQGSQTIIHSWTKPWILMSTTSLQKWLSNNVPKLPS